MTARQSMLMVIPAALALGWAGSVAADEQKFPATGQTTSFLAGDDGAIQAGATLSYKDNGNGTITDRNTRLVWEKKSDDLSIHNVNNAYTWDEAFTLHVAILNNTCANNETVTCSANADCVAAGVGGKCGFAGKRDWRVPNAKELQSIVNYGIFFPMVSSAFNTNCVPNATVLDGSCTAATYHWSSTTSLANFPTDAMIVSFRLGDVSFIGKMNAVFPVRAVRGGTP